MNLKKTHFLGRERESPIHAGSGLRCVQQWSLPKPSQRKEPDPQSRSSEWMSELQALEPSFAVGGVRTNPGTPTGGVHTLGRILATFPNVCTGSFLK